MVFVNFGHQIYMDYCKWKFIPYPQRKESIFENKGDLCTRREVFKGSLRQGPSVVI